MPFLETVPAWWKLGWNPDVPALEVWVAKAFLAELPPIPSTAPMIQLRNGLVTQGLYSSFCCDLSAESFGFNKSVQRMEMAETTADFIQFRIPLPRIRHLTEESCPNCNGTGSWDIGGRCPFCHGLRFGSSFKWNAGFSTTRSLALLFYLLETLPRSNMPTKVPQLLSLRLCADGEINGSSIGDELSRDALRIFDCAVHGESRIAGAMKDSITTAMRGAWRHIMGYGAYCEPVLGVNVSDTCNLCLTCSPGDAAVYTQNSQTVPNHGCKIGSHGMQNPAQALVCLAGLGAFSEELQNLYLRRQVVSS